MLTRGSFSSSPASALRCAPCAYHYYMLTPEERAKEGAPAFWRRELVEPVLP